MDVDVDHDNAHKEPKPYEKLWIPDGNVVLATDTHLFKVHKSILSMQSSVFRDMFELPTIGDMQTSSKDAGLMPEMYEGVPLVNLVGDKGEDIVHLLHAVYERQYYRIDKDNTALEVVTALLLLSTKYDFKHIQRDVIAHISKHYPMTLAACDAVEDHKSPLFGQTQVFSHFALLKALHTANVDVLLPSAYYACADYFPEVFGEKAGFLGLECFTTLMVGKNKLGTEMNELVAKLPGELLAQAGFYDCSNEENHIRFCDLDYYMDMGDIKYLEGSLVIRNSIEGICDECKSKLITLINTKRQEIWEKVPGCFGFPGWDVLRVKLEEILSSEN